MTNALYGFIDLQHLFDQRVSDAGVDTVATAITQSVEEHNRQMNALMSLFATPTTEYKIRFQTPTVARLQPIEQDGRARPIQPAGFYDVAYPVFHAGVAWGANRVTRAKMTVADANRITSTLISADMRWVRDHMLSALFANTSWNFADPEHGTLAIQGLANGDAVQYLVQLGADAGATDTHYLAQANAIDNSNDPFPAIHTELTEHPENGGDVVAIIPTNLKAAVQGLAGFYPLSDANIRMGANQSELVGSLGVSVPGEIIGYHDSGVWISEWRSMVSSYILATVTDGPRPLAMREHAESELRGFAQVATRDDHPFWESHWERLAGFGAQNRVGAVVQRIGNGSYAVPTGYAAPLA
jgi:hypothetical protein